MAQADMPNPIELYEAARDYMVPIIGGVKASQLTDSTPCSEWNVQQLINHILKVAGWAHSILTGGPAVDDLSVNDPLPDEGAPEAFGTNTDRVLAVIKASGMLEKVVSTPFGDMPAGNFLMFPFGDILIHKWDLAKATGQDISMDSSMAQVVYRAWAPVLEGMRAPAFGPAVPVRPTASDRDKLLGLTGRTP